MQSLSPAGKERTDMTEKIFQTGLGDVHYWVGGPGAGTPWLVFLPGLTADHHLFDKQVEVFAPRFNCLVWDAPAHGKSRPFALEFSMDDLADCLHAILEREGAAGPVLVGQSLGGYISQVYIERYPGAVSGFVSIDSGPMKREYYTDIELLFLKHTEGMYRSIPWKWLLSWGSAGNAETDCGRVLMRRIMESYEKREYCALTGYGFRILAQRIEAGGSFDIGCPALLLCGEKDGAGSIKRYNWNWTRREDLPLVWIPGAGHNSNTDAPEFVNREIEEFVSAVVPVK